ncbi:MAG TPA: hypothetical protein VJQ51_12445, partial [Burkholderiales bacterium]|nr:hypothetical protein [Burkholderiales bacterium]
AVILPPSTLAAGLSRRADLLADALAFDSGSGVADPAARLCAGGSAVVPRSGAGADGGDAMVSASNM